MNSPPALGSMAKAALRKAVKECLRMTPLAQRESAAGLVRERLQQQTVWREARSILFYAARPDEVDLRGLWDAALQEGRLVALPQFDAATGVYRACPVAVPMHQLPLGRYGIPEPAPSAAALPLQELDLILIPGVAFDMKGRRLGRGGGYYDRLLPTVAGIKCGVGFNEQLRDFVPIESHDVLLDCLVTPAHWLDFRYNHHGNERVG